MSWPGVTEEGFGVMVSESAEAARLRAATARKTIMAAPLVKSRRLTTGCQSQRASLRHQQFAAASRVPQLLLNIKKRFY
jgi:hypothetical protein